MPLWLAVVLLILTGAGLALCRSYLRGNKTACILCTGPSTTKSTSPRFFV